MHLEATNLVLLRFPATLYPRPFSENIAVLVALLVIIATCLLCSVEAFAAMINQNFNRWCCLIIDIVIRMTFCVCVCVCLFVCLFVSTVATYSWHLLICNPVVITTE